jgi:hypothetical protein
VSGLTAGPAHQYLFNHTEGVRDISRWIKRRSDGGGVVLVGDELRRAQTLAGGQRGCYGIPGSPARLGEAGVRRGRRRRGERGSWEVLRGSESSPPSGCCRGGLRGNSGGLGLNWRGEGVEEVQEGEGNLLVCGKRPGDAPFIGLGVAEAERDRSSSSSRLRWASVIGEGAAVLAMSPRTRRASWR